MSQHPLFKVTAQVEVDQDALRAIISDGVEEYLNASLAQRVSSAISERIAQQGSACLSEVVSIVSTPAPSAPLGSEATSPRQKRTREGSSAVSSSVADTSMQHGTDGPVVGLMRIKTEPGAGCQPSGLSVPIGSARAAPSHALNGAAENREPDECDLTGDDGTDVDVLGDDDSAPPEDFEPPSPDHTLVRTLVPTPDRPTVPERDDPFESLPDDWKSWYGEVVWCRWGLDRKWYPACIANPSTTTDEVFELARRWIGRKHLVYFYPAEGYDVVGPEHIRLFAGTTIANFATAEHLNKIVPGILVARYELRLDREQRLEWQVL